jgi:CelD/BcsL family acetyltransferase involved in cellulose biosynthesis
MQSSASLEPVIMILQSKTLDICVHTDPSGAATAEAWNALVDVSTYPNVFRRWEWQNLWWKWFGNGCQPYVLSLSRGGELVGIVPLYASPTRFGKRKLTWIGAGGPTFPEYLGPVIRQDCGAEAIEAIGEHFRHADRTWDSLWLPDVPPDDLLTRALMDALGRVFWTIRVPGAVCPMLELPESFDLLLKRLSHHGRQREKGKLRKARKAFRVGLRSVERQDELEAAFGAIVELHQSARVLHGEQSPFADQTYAAFHREIIETLLPKGLARLYLLLFNDKPVAFQYGYVYGGKYYAFQVGFDSSAAAYSPGAVLFQLVFDELIRQGVREFDFLRGQESYKNNFAACERRTETALICRRAAPIYAYEWVRSRIVYPLRGRAKKWLAPSP